MMARIQKWGNSLGVRIPKGLAQDAGVEEGTSVDLQVENGRLVIAPVKDTYDLEKLLDQVTPESLHGEVDTGTPAGREDW